MSLTPLGISHWRWQLVDFSEPLFMDETRVIYQRPTPQADIAGFAKPYSSLVWLLLLLCVVFVFMVTFLTQMAWVLTSQRDTADRPFAHQSPRDIQRKRMSSDAEETLLWIIVALCAAKKSRKPKRKMWCNQWLSRRNLRGSFNQILTELEMKNPSDFENYTRMPVSAFHELLGKVKPYISNLTLIYEKVYLQEHVLRPHYASLHLEVPIRACNILQGYQSRASALSYLKRAKPSTMFSRMIT
ncbi:hypothetical protein Pcinc_004534 [Petrolisthes cinctipes]|uniref:Uncharacterized protein n=1 Tax=Petrolisthes cinctipes TaxID=88211 RepID=A0AAE1GGW8_PETCI|nr:hypothetical protein Pcinc_004534 [Petrolisthes cinctipes]